MQDFSGAGVIGEAIGSEKITYLNGVSAGAGAARNIEIVAIISVLTRSR
jgi:hypothetical protein